MAFLTENDYKAVIDQYELEDITDSESSTRKVAEDTAQSMVSDYLNSRYDIENIFNKTGSERHPSIVWACVTISLYLLHQRLHPNAIPETRSDQYDRAMDWLKGVQKRVINPINLPLVTTGVKDDILYGGETRRSSRI